MTTVNGDTQLFRLLTVGQCVDVENEWQTSHLSCDGGEDGGEDIGIQGRTYVWRGGHMYGEEDIGMEGRT